LATIRSSRRIERAGVNAVRTLLEDQDYLVQEIDGGNDHGEDLIVNLTRNGKRTGHYFAAQVKSGTKYRRAHGYAVPVDDHYEDWRDSRIPVLGIVYDPETAEIFWTNLTKELRARQQKWVQIPKSARLSPDTIRGFAAEVEAYVDDVGMRIRGDSPQEAFAHAVQARKGLDPEMAPNPLYEGLADLALRHEDRINKVGHTALRCIPLAILLLIMVLEWSDQLAFVRRYSDLNPYGWVLCLYYFIFYMAATMFFEFRAGRIPRETGRWFALIIGNFLWVPVYDRWDHHASRGWWGTLWIVLGCLAPAYGFQILLFSYVRQAIARRRKARQAA